MISRIWHGWTTRENADAYERLLRTEIFSGIANRSIQGYRGIHLLRRDVEDGVEFMTIMWFDSLDAVRASGIQAASGKTVFGNRSSDVENKTIKRFWEACVQECLRTGR